MEEIIAELQRHYDEICAYEILEIYPIALDRINARNFTESHIQSQEYRNTRKNSQNDSLNNLLGVSEKKENKSLLEDLMNASDFDINLYRKIEGEIREKNPERTKVLFTLKELLNYYASGMNSLFVNFIELKNVLDYLHVSFKNQLTIFVNIVENNGALGCNKVRNIFLDDYDALVNREYKYATSEKVANLILSSKLIDYLIDENPEIPEAQKEILDCLKVIKGDSIEQYITSFRLHCIFATKVYKLNEDSFTSVKKNMELLGFGDLSEIVIKQMKKDKNAYKREQEEKNKKKGKNQFQEDSNKKQETDAPKKQTSLNQTLREINKYFDLDNLELKEELSLDQIIYILSLMYSIEVEDNKIETFLREAMRTFKEFHPYAIYNQAYDKFVYLGNDNPEIKQHIEMIEYILSESNIFMCDEEKYKSTKKLIEEEINELMRVINGNYTYEIEEAKKILKTSEE